MSRSETATGTDQIVTNPPQARSHAEQTNFTRFAHIVIHNICGEPLVEVVHQSA